MKFQKIFVPGATMLALAASLFCLPAAGQSADVNGLNVIALASPPFKKLSARPGRTAVRIEATSERPNTVTDGDSWFKRTQTRLNEYSIAPGLADVPTLGDVPANVPREFRGLKLVKGIGADNGIFLVYGKDFADGRILVRYDLDGRGPAFRYAYDFSSYLASPGKDAETIRFEKQYGEGIVDQRIVWAAEKDNILYVANAHNTYAKSSLNLNAYITAIDLRTNAIKWRSAPLVANAGSFEIVKDAIICGYGFTKEPDFLYVLDRSTGDVAQKVPVRSGPECLIMKGQFLYVRCYDTDYVFKVNG